MVVDMGYAASPASNRVRESVRLSERLMKGVFDTGRNQGDKRYSGQPPDMPDQSETKHGGDGRKNHACAGIFWHMDGHKTAGRALVAVLFHIPPGIKLMHDGGEGEIVIGRGGGC